MLSLFHSCFTYLDLLISYALFSGNGTQNSYFKVVNEHSSPNIYKANQNGNIKLVIEPKKVPSILKRPNVCNQPSLVIQPDSTNGGKIAIVPVSRNKSPDLTDVNIVPAKVC